MRKNSRFFGLDYMVQCCFPGNHHFETIAAMGFSSVAIDYAKEVFARQIGEGWRWRVVHWKHNEPECLWRSEDEASKPTPDQTNTVTDPQTGMQFGIACYVPHANPVKIDLSIHGSKPRFSEPLPGNGIGIVGENG